MRLHYDCRELVARVANKFIGQPAAFSLGVASPFLLTHRRILRPGVGCIGEREHHRDLRGRLRRIVDFEQKKRHGERGFTIVVFDDRAEELQANFGLESLISAPPSREQRLVIGCAGIEARPGGKHILGGQGADHRVFVPNLFPHVEGALGKESFFVSSHLQLPRTECAAEVVHKIPRANSAQRQTLLDPQERVSPFDPLGCTAARWILGRLPSGRFQAQAGTGHAWVVGAGA